MIDPNTPSTTSSSQASAASDGPMIAPSSDEGKRKVGTRPNVLLVVVGVVLAVGGVLCAGVFFSVQAMGKNGPLSSLSANIPFESISLFDSFRKSNSELIADAVAMEIDPERVARLKGQEKMASMQIDLAGKIGGSSSATSFTGAMNMNAKMAVAANNETMKAHYDFGGHFASGIFSFDLGIDGLQGDILVKNSDEIYLKGHLNEKTQDTLLQLSAMNGPQGEQSFQQVQSYLDKYYLVRPSEYQQLMNEKQQQMAKLYLPDSAQAPTATFDVEALKKAQQELVKDLTPGLLSLVRNSAKDLSDDASIEVLDRQTVAGRSAMVFQLTVTPDQLANASQNTIKELLSFVVAHKEAIKKYCEATSIPSMYTKDCSAQISELESEIQDFSNTKQEQSKKGFSEFFKVIRLDSVVLYIDPIDNSLLKAKMVLSVDPSKLNGKESAISMDSMKFTFVEEEVSRGKDVQIDVPQGAQNLVEMLKQEPGLLTK